MDRIPDLPPGVRAPVVLYFHAVQLGLERRRQPDHAARLAGSGLG
jgi:hypothetical protein